MHRIALGQWDDGAWWRRSGIDIIYTGQISQIILFWWCTFKRSANYMPFYGTERWDDGLSFSRRGFCAWILCAQCTNRICENLTIMPTLLGPHFVGIFREFVFGWKAEQLLASIRYAFNYWDLFKLTDMISEKQILQMIFRLDAIRVESISCYS